MGRHLRGDDWGGRHDGQYATLMHDLRRPVHRCVQDLRSRFEEVQGVRVVERDSRGQFKGSESLNGVQVVRVVERGFNYSDPLKRTP